jgi:hypothetical protein
MDKEDQGRDRVVDNNNKFICFLDQTKIIIIEEAIGSRVLYNGTIYYIESITHQYRGGKPTKIYNVI